jgi:hypothetical protein
MSDIELDDHIFNKEASQKERLFNIIHNLFLIRKIIYFHYFIKFKFNIQQN